MSREPGQALAYMKVLARRAREHHLTLVSAGVAFYAFLAFVPGVIIAVSLYGRVSEPSDINEQVHSFARALPDEVERFIQSQITAVAKADPAGISATLVVALLIALWSASGGMAALLTGIRVAFGEAEPEGYVKKRAKALGLTLAALLLLGVVIFLVAPLPALIADTGLATEGRIVVNVLRWPVLLFLMAFSLGVAYRAAGSRHRRPHLGVITRGAIAGALVWLVASGAFSFYTANFSRYSRRYGTLASIVVVLLWLYLSALAVLIGAEVDGASTTAAQADDDAPERIAAAHDSTSVST
jgi:membrane protein